VLSICLHVDRTVGVWLCVTSLVPSVVMLGGGALRGGVWQEAIRSGALPPEDSGLL
jgi:hypothetical protein